MRVRRSLLNLSPQRVALIKPSALGDIMHALPVLTAMRQRFPQARITWIVNRLYEPLLRNHPDLDATIAFDRQLLRAGWLSGMQAFAKFLKLIRDRRFDLVIDLQGLLRTGLMSLASGAKYRVGLTSAREGARLCYSDLIDDIDEHAVDRYWRVAQSLGAGALTKHFRLPVEASARRWALSEMADCPRPWLAVAVGARWLTKRWPPEHFATLVRQTLDRFGGTAIFVGAPDEADLARQAATLLSTAPVWRAGGVSPPSQSRYNVVRDLTGQTSLPQLAAVLSEVDLMLANDTGPLHLAVALGRPVVAPYTCTTVRRTGPYGQERRAVETAVWCRGSYLRQCSRLECMAELTPARLWPAIEEILLTWERQRRSA